MARLKDEVIDQIKSQVSLLRLVESQGHKPKAHGKDKVIACPFHQDDTASLVISSNNLFNCFGCGAAGSVIDWVIKTQGVSFRFACELLQQDISLIASNGETPIKQNTTTKLSFSLAADHQVALTQVIDYYHETLKQCVEVHEYLASRGLDCPKLIEYFRLGYANRTLAYRLPAKNRKAGGEIRGQLQDIGILRQSGHEHFNGSLVVPVFNEQGDITEVYGRKILGARLRKGTAQHLYLPGSHRGVFNTQGLVEQSQLAEPSTVVILCEAIIDAMTFWRHGFTNVTSSYGTQGFTDDHLELFKRLNIKTVLIAYDNDEAGNQAASVLAEKLLTDGFEVFRVEVPKDMDINSYACAVTPAQKNLSQIIRQARWLGKEGMGKKRMSDDVKRSHDFSLAALAAKDEPAPKKVEDNEKRQTQTAPPLAAELTNASPVPASPSLNIDTEINEQEITLNLTGRTYRIRGLERNTGLEQLKINLLVKHQTNDGDANGDSSENNSAFHVDTLDLYASKARFSFIKQASLELGVNAQLIKSDLGKVLLALEDIQAKQLTEALEVKKTAPVLTEGEMTAAMALLQDSTLLKRIINDFETCGVVGERVNTLMGYLAGVSRKLSRPLAVMVQSSSAAGKSALMDAVLNFMPLDERVQYSAMTGQSLFYMGETNLKHKILAISEEEGAESASYALKLLQSEGEVTIASTGKNATTGNLETQEYRVEGPVMLFLTTTAIDIDEELLNRCLVLTVNESREQTQAIHEIQRQRRTLDGLKASVAKSQLVTLHQHAQQLLKPLAVVNPFANQLSFLDNQTRTRRDHEKYLTLIDSIALLHQHQRPLKTLAGQGGESIEYIEATLDDIAVANSLASDVLGRTLDELPPQTRTLLGLIYTMVQQISQQQQITPNDCHFSRRQIREFSDWGNTQLKVHCQRLEDMEYLIVKRGGRGSTLVYELAWSGEGNNGHSFLMGLSCLKKLGYDAKKSGVSKVLSALGRGQVAVRSGGSQSDNKPPQANSSKTLEASALTTPPSSTTLGDNTPSYQSSSLAASLVNNTQVMS